MYWKLKTAYKGYPSCLCTMLIRACKKIFEFKITKMLLHLALMESSQPCTSIKDTKVAFTVVGCAVRYFLHGVLRSNNVLKMFGPEDIRTSYKRMIQVNWCRQRKFVCSLTFSTILKGKIKVCLVINSVNPILYTVTAFSSDISSVYVWVWENVKETVLHRGWKLIVCKQEAQALWGELSSTVIQKSLLCEETKEWRQGLALWSRIMTVHGRPGYPSFIVNSNCLSDISLTSLALCADSLSSTQLLSYPGYVLSCTISSAGFTGPSSHIQPLCVRLKLMANILITVTVWNRVSRVRILVPTHLYMFVTLDCIPQKLRFSPPSPPCVCLCVWASVRQAHCLWYMLVLLALCT